MIRIVEIMGFPQAGKSSMIAQLPGAVRELRPDIRVLAYPEFGNRAYLRKEIRRAMLAISLEAEGHLLESLKLAAFSEVLGQAIEVLLREAQQKEHGAPVLLVVERGPNDTLFWHFAHYVEGRNKEELPVSIREDLNGTIRVNWNRYWFTGAFERASILVWSLGLTPFVDAVVFYQVSLEAAMKRRERQGLPREGRFVNPKMWPVLEQARECLISWLEYCYEGRFLLVNGEKSLADNNREVKDFVLGQLSGEIPDNQRIRDFLFWLQDRLRQLSHP